MATENRPILKVGKELTRVYLPSKVTSRLADLGDRIKPYITNIYEDADIPEDIILKTTYNDKEYTGWVGMIVIESYFQNLQEVLEYLERALSLWRATKEGKGHTEADLIEIETI